LATGIIYHYCKNTLDDEMIASSGIETGLPETETIPGSRKSSVISNSGVAPGIV
jgi:hypothetical protein